MSAAKLGVAGVASPPQQCGLYTSRLVSIRGHDNYPPVIHILLRPGMLKNYRFKP